MYLIPVACRDGGHPYLEEPAMGDTESTTAESAESDTEDRDVTAGAERPDAVANALKAEREARRKAERELKAERDARKQAEDEGKTEAERIAARLSELETSAQENALRAARAEVSNEFGVPAELLHGSDRDEMAASAERLKSFAQRQAKQSRAATDGLDGGAKPPATESTPATVTGAALLALAGRTPRA